jgi:Subtilase family/Pentapeptide repeats (8 copies)
MPGVFDHGKVDAVARRFSRRATAAVAAGLAVACAALTAAPALADQVRDQEWWLSALHVSTAWESSKGAGVTVAVLDTGVNPAQADLTGSVTTGPDYTASGRKAGAPFWGVHGTAVASLIAGHGHGTQKADGIIGVAPSAKILSVRVTLEGNDPLLASPAVVARLPEAISKGIRYAVSHGADVIDLPMDPAALKGTTAGGSTAERNAVAYALSKHVVLVAPGGDGGAGTDPVNYPAAYPGVISVGAFDQHFTKAAFTSRRSYVTLTAAGDGVIAATQPAGYTMIHSTSAASAVVAGIAALIRAQFPTLTPAQVTSALTSSTVFRPPGGKLDGSGSGTADAQAALVAAARINAAVPSGSASGGAVTAPTSPAVRAAGEGVWGMLRSVALAVAAGLLLLLIVVALYLRAQRRRSRNARLAPLREAGRVAVRAQPEYSAAPPTVGAQFTGAQFTGAHPAGAQFTGAQFTAAPAGRSRGSRSGGSRSRGSRSGGSRSGGSHSSGSRPGAPLPGGPPSGGSQPGGAPFSGSQLGGSQFSGSQLGGSQFSGSQLGGSQLGASRPGGPQFAGAPFHEAQSSPQSLSPGDNPALAPFPGDGPALAPFPGDAPGLAPFPGDDTAQIPFPGDAPGLAPFPGDDTAQIPLPGDAPGLAPFPGDQVADPQIAGGNSAGSAPFPAAPPANSAVSTPARALPPTPRPSVVRPPRISGAPPWQPAEKPDGELPWASTPSPKAAHSRSAPPRRVIPTGAQPRGMATHEGTAEDGAVNGGGVPGRPEPRHSAPGDPGPDTAVPGRAELGGQAPGSMPLPAPQTRPGDAAADDDPDDDGSKLYLWNPAEVTQAFPVMPPTGEPGTDRG